MLHFSHGSTDMNQTFRLVYASIRTTYPANFIKITDIVPQMIWYEVWITAYPASSVAVKAALFACPGFHLLTVTRRTVVDNAHRYRLAAAADGLLKR